VTPGLDIVVVSHNTATVLDACLRSLEAHPPSIGSAITVVDNASHDGSVELLRSRHPSVQVVALDRNIGFAAANNLAIRQTSAPLVLLLNSDTIVPRGAIDTLIERLRSTGAVAAGPRLVDADGQPEVSFGSMLSPFAELRQAVRMRRARRRGGAARASVERLLATERTVDWVTGACLLVERRAAVDVGLLDERYFMYEEDVDFCAALRANGGRVLFTPRAEIVHLRGRSGPPASGRRSPHYDRSHLAFYEKHLPHWAPVLRMWQRVRPRRPLP
jgi:N-acetylglucosaminyl-diphospho-decaprenol L-rhamnosyltransferase